MGERIALVRKRLASLAELALPQAKPVAEHCLIDVLRGDLR